MCRVTEADVILDKIHDENPEFWPHGLNKEQFDGGLYLVKENSTDASVGFVGWQQRQLGMRKVGYYSVGILPEYRKLGFAKEAVKKLLAEKSGSVDEVRALIKRDNLPSQALASRLEGVKVMKVATAIPKNPLNRLAHWAIDGINEPAVLSGSNISEAQRRFSRGNYRGGFQQVGAAAANMLDSGVNLALLGSGVALRTALAGSGKAVVGFGSRKALGGVARRAILHNPEMKSHMARYLAKPQTLKSTLGTLGSHINDVAVAGDTWSYLKHVPGVGRMGNMVLKPFNRISNPYVREPVKLVTGLLPEYATMTAAQKIQASQGGYMAQPVYGSQLY